MITRLLSSLEDLAGIQYAGQPGFSASCLDAVKQIVQMGKEILAVRVVTHEQDHGLLFTLAPGDLLAVKVGFASGYAGAGPATFSKALRLLEVFNADIEEYEVPAGFLSRLDASALTRKDIEQLDAASPIRPRRIGDYVLTESRRQDTHINLLGELAPIMPWAIIDPEVVDLALGFFDQPDKAILDAFRRLESKVRTRTGLEEHGAKLFSQAFEGDRAPLGWEGLDKGEQAGRALLFRGAYQTFRNPRAHRPSPEDAQACLAEFLLVSQLFTLERQATTRTADADTEEKTRSSRPLRPEPKGDAGRQDQNERPRAANPPSSGR